MSFDRANELLRESPRAARELALELLATKSDPRRWLGFAIVGSAFRSEGRFVEAEAAFYLAATCRPGRPDEEFQLLGKLANLYRDQGVFHPARRLLARKISLAGTPLDEARARLEWAIVQSDPSYPDTMAPVSVHDIKRVRAVFEAAEDRPYVIAALGLELLAASKDPSFPPKSLEPLLGEYLQTAVYPRGTYASAQVHWLSAAAYRRLGKPERAALALEEAARGFEAQSMPVFWAVAKLDQAALELSYGSAQRAGEICGLIFPVLSAYRQNAQAWVAIRALFEASSRVALTHFHLANARRALLKAQTLSRSGR